MARPSKCRRVEFLPNTTYFKPAGIPLQELEEVCLSVEEAEAVRLKDLAGLEQEAGAEKMNISRPTFQRILAAARQKMADALLNGKAIRINGGNFQVCWRRFRCPRGHEWELENPVTAPPAVCPRCRMHHIEPVLPASAGGISNHRGYVAIRAEGNPAAKKVNKTKKETMMKIAVISDDGKTVSQHFGMAPLYVVATVENGKVVSKETRNKIGHQHLGDNPHAHDTQGGRHGFGAHAQNAHAMMAQNIDDCQVLLAGGMGWGAFESMKSRGIEPVITDVQDVDEALQQYLKGTLPNLREKLH